MVFGGPQPVACDSISTSLLLAAVEQGAEEGNPVEQGRSLPTEQAHDNQPPLVTVGDVGGSLAIGDFLQVPSQIPLLQHAQGAPICPC